MYYFKFMLPFYLMPFAFTAQILPMRLNDDIKTIENAGYAAYIQPIYTVMLMPKPADAAADTHHQNEQHAGAGRRIFDRNVLQLASLILQLPSTYSAASSSTSSSSASSPSSPTISADDISRMRHVTLRNLAIKEYLNNKYLMQPKIFS